MKIDQNQNKRDKVRSIAMASSTNTMTSGITDDIIISNSGHLHSKQNKSNRSEANLNQALELTNILQSTLDLETLFQLFVREAQKTISFSGLEYINKDVKKNIKFGRKAKHQCNYRLLVGSQKLGSLTIFGTNPFTESETISLEYLFSSLLYPLRNTILYLIALRTALIDPLTGTNNRSAFDSTLQREIDLSKRHGSPLSILIADIDHFKQINDEFGHLYGDCVLREVAQKIQKSIRSSDILFRYGGEEFAIILSNTQKEGANLTAERIRFAIAKTNDALSKKDSSQKITISIGGTVLLENDDPSSFFERADNAMYQAKNTGRNCVCFCTSNPEKKYRN